MLQILHTDQNAYLVNTVLLNWFLVKGNMLGL